MTGPIVADPIWRPPSEDTLEPVLERPLSPAHRRESTPETFPAGSFDGSRRRHGGSDVAFGIAAQILQMGSSLLLLPIIVARLDNDEVGFWYVFMTIQTLVYLIDFGFVPTFSRNFNYVFAGATAILEEGLPPPPRRSEVHATLLISLLATSRQVYAVMTLITAVVLGTAGTLYVGHLSADTGLSGSIWVDWTIFSATLVGHTYFQWQITVLNGADRLRESYEVAVVSRLVQVVASVIGLIISPSLTTLVLAYALSAVIMRVHLHLCMRDILSKVRYRRADTRRYPGLMSLLWRNTHRYGIVLLSSFLIARFNIMVIAWFLGVAMSAQFAIANQALVAIMGVSHVLISTNSPKLINAKVHGDVPRAQKILSASLVFMWVVFLCGVAGLVLLGPFLIGLIRKTAELPDLSVMLLMASAAFIESNLQIATGVITNDNKIPFRRAYVVAGVLVAGGCVLAGHAGFGLATFLIIQIGVQLSYNAWKWPRLALRDAGLRLAEIPARALSGFQLLLLHR